MTGIDNQGERKPGPPNRSPLVLASTNPGKLDELRILLREAGFPPDTIRAVPASFRVEEDGETFEANAVKKAAAAARATGCWALGDDSGLEVRALGGAPGPRSARFAGEPPDDARNNRKLLDALADQADRRARFRCVLALCRPGGGVRTVEGLCEGVIGRAPRGNNGFGYDPLFLPDGHERTFAELPADVKNRISHRARALAAARQAWFVRGFPPADFPANHPQPAEKP